MWSVHGLNHASSAEPPPSLDTVSSLLADIARQQADRGRLYEEQGNYLYSQGEYRNAIAGLDRNFAPPSNHATGNPKVFLARGGAYVDLARVLSKMQEKNLGGNHQKEILKAAESAELDFNAVIRNSNSDSAGRDMIQKAMLGLGYAGLLRGDLVQARTNFADIKSPQTLGPLVTSDQVQGAMFRIKADLDAQARKPTPKSEEEKLTAYMKLGLEIVKVAFPKYQGLAMAIGEVLKASRK